MVPAWSSTGQIGAAVVLAFASSSWVAFVLACLGGFGQVSVGLSASVLALGAATVRTSDRTRGAPVAKRISSPAEVAALVLLLPVFCFGVWSDSKGSIYFLGNFADLPFHLSFASGFLEQTLFPPTYPHAAGAPLTYHFLVNFHTAALAMAGWPLLPAFFFDEIVLALALALCAGALVNDLAPRTPGAVAMAAFVWGHNGAFTVAAAAAGVPIANFPMSAWKERFEAVLLFPFFNFFHPLMNFFMPQRPMLAGFAALAVGYSVLLRAGRRGRLERREVVSLAALVAILPLLHLHSFLLLAPALVGAALAPGRPRGALFAAGTGLAAAMPQVLYLLAASKGPSYSGFDVLRMESLREIPVWGSAVLAQGVFWMRVLGPLALLVPGLCAVGLAGLRSASPGRRWIVGSLSAPLVASFLVINVYRLTPNWGDSNKLVLPALLLLCAFATKTVAEAWRSRRRWTAMAAATILALSSAPGVWDYTRIWQSRFDRGRWQLMFSHEDRECARWVSEQTPRDSVIATAESVLHFVPALAGRPVVRTFYANGLDRPGTSDRLRKLFETGDWANSCDADFVFVGRYERSQYPLTQAVLTRALGPPISGPGECALFPLAPKCAVVVRSATQDGGRLLPASKE